MGKYIVEQCTVCNGRGYTKTRNIKLPCLRCGESGHEFLDKSRWHAKVCKDSECKDIVHSDIVFAFRGIELNL